MRPVWHRRAQVLYTCGGAAYLVPSGLQNSLAMGAANTSTMGSHSFQEPHLSLLARINLPPASASSLQTPLGPALGTTFAIKPTCLAKGPAHPPATGPRGLRGNGASRQRHATTCIQTDGQTATYSTYACPDAAKYTHPSIEALPIEACPFDRPPPAGPAACGPHASFRPGRPT